MYLWRKLTPEQRQELLRERIRAKRPWHHPPHLTIDGSASYLFTGACYEHRPHVGYSLERLDEFTGNLVGLFDILGLKVQAWVVLPNHYHLLAATADLRNILRQLGRLHGRTSYIWNGEENTRGRQVWHGVVETVMKSDAHLWATLNYVHHNPVKHGVVEYWQDWPFGSANVYLDTVGRDEAKRIWSAYPVGDYGKSRDP